MLVLARRKEETIRFPELGIEVKILKVNGHSVRVGVTAPKEVNIVRGELVKTESQFVAEKIVEGFNQLEKALKEVAK